MCALGPNARASSCRNVEDVRNGSELLTEDLRYLVLFGLPEPAVQPRASRGSEFCFEVRERS